MQAQPIFIYLICYGAFSVAERASKKNNSHKLSAILFENGSMDLWQLRTIYGLLVISSSILYCLSIGSIDLFGNSFLRSANAIQNVGKTTIYIIAGAFIITMKDLQVNSRQSVSVVKNIFPYFALQIPFIVVYELFFRGVLLFEMTRITSPVAAIIIIAALQAALHSSKNKSELFWTVLSSVSLSVICLDIQSALPAVLIRLITSVIYEIRLYYYSQIFNHP